MKLFPGGSAGGVLGDVDGDLGDINGIGFGLLLGVQDGVADDGSDSEAGDSHGGVAEGQPPLLVQNLTGVVSGRTLRPLHPGRLHRLRAHLVGVCVLPP